jgi:hypothetical protein
LAPNNDPLQIRSIDVPIDTFPVLHNIVSAYECFYNSFSQQNLNFLDAYIFENDFFRDAQMEKINISFFGRRFYEQYRNQIRRLSFSKCFHNNEFLSLNRFRETGLPLPYNTWFRLRSVLLLSRQRIQQVTTVVETTTFIDTFAARWKKGCKKMRIILGNDREINNCPSNSRSFNTFSRLIGGLVIEKTYIKDWLSIWNICCLPNDFRNFVFNSRFNFIPTNNRLNSYIKEVDPRCTFCILKDATTTQRDSYVHCFFECNTVQELLATFLMHCNFDINILDAGFPNLYWYGIYKAESLTKTRHRTFALIFDVFRYTVFRSRIKKRNPDPEVIVQEIIYFISNVCRYNNKIAQGILGSIETNTLQAFG